MAVDTTDDFQKELVDLFVQEAQEWLQNIHVALDELQQGPAPERHAKLVGTISAGVTNLGGSAATINLPEVEQASFDAIPFIDALRDPQKTFSAQDFLSLCKQLGQIHTTLTRATGISFEADGNSATAEAVRTTLAPGEFLHLLQELQKHESLGVASGRNIIGSLMEQMERQVQAGVERIDVAVIQGYLARVSEGEESFVKAIHERVPEILEQMGDLKIDGNEASARAMALNAALQDVAQLRAEAQQVNAGSAVMFLTGLHSLLTMVAQRRVLLIAARVESVKARVHAMGSPMCGWVEQGRAQRAAIDQMLSAGHS